MVKLLAAASLICIAIVLAGANRGFDISDEGLYVLLADPSQENVAGIFNYDLFFKLIFKIAGYSFSVIELRVFRLLSYLAGAWALAVFWKNSSGEPNLRAEIFWISCLGLFAGYAFLPPTLSYNSITVVLVCLWLSQITKTVNSYKSILFLGIILAWLVYVKVSLVLIFFPLTVFLLFVGQKRKFFDLVWIFLPLVIFETVFFILFNESAVSRLIDGIPLNSRRSGYGFFLMLKSIAVGGFWCILAGLLFFAIGYFQKIKSSYYPGFKLIGAYGIIVVGFLTHITDEWNHLILLFSAAFLGFQMGNGVFNPSKTNFWILLLLFLPFLLHLGSNIYWLRIGVHYLVFWIVAFRWVFKHLSWEVSLISALTVTSLVFNGIWWHPFGQNEPLWAEKLSWSPTPNGVVEVDPDLVVILRKIESVGRDHGSTPILAAYRIPGLVWLHGHQLPKTPGIWENGQLDELYETKPERMIYNGFQELPTGWVFRHSLSLGVYQGDSLSLLWD